MVDIHCHILPWIDDGASSMEEALEMAAMAHWSGVTDIVATPHFRGDRSGLDQLDQIRRGYENLQRELTNQKIPVKLHCGAEILCLPETATLAEERLLPTLSNSHYVLVEFYFDESFEYMDRMLEAISRNGYWVIVAHPERYGVIQRHPVLLERWVRKGYVIQMNKGSVLGSFGTEAQQTANALLALGMVHLIASDAHGCLRRTPHMGQIQQWAHRCCTESCASILLDRNPHMILQGKPVVEMDGREDR
jgi:protein-tyrosine phosphatase